LDENDSELENEDDSILDSVFDINLDDTLKSDIINDNKMKLNVKREREINDTIVNINLFPKQNDMAYESFISDNNLILSEIIIPQKTKSIEKINKELKEKFDIFLKMKNLYFSNESMKINDKVNLINKAYSFNDIKVFF
jgi:hypothetical protein